jgi:EAL and modified HD-GYP domain-containing signal transduction protein
VLEVLETVNAEPEVLHALRRARELGYQIALDDFVRNDRTSGLLDYADYVKVDVLGLSESQIVDAYRELQRPGLRLLAEKVETRAVHEHALRAGFDLFQGYYFARPEIVERHRLPSDRNALLRLLSELQDPATPLERIETLIAADVGLSVRLVRYVNAAVFGVRQKIESLRHAVVMLGIDRLRECVAMLLLAGLDGKPSQLVTLALVRARMCEMLGEHSRGQAHRHFSAGLLSLLDAFLDQPLEEIVQQMGLTDDLNDALLRRSGDLGSSLRAAEACERAEWEVMDGTSWDPGTLRTCYLEAMTWTGRVQSILAAH